MTKNKWIVILALLAISIFFAIDTFQVGIDNDLLWHYKLGEIILQNGVTELDYFSWQENLKWISQEWLFDIYIYFIINTFGNIGFITVNALCSFGIGMLYFKENKNYKSALLFVIFFLLKFMFPQNSFNRPSIYSTILIMLLLFNLFKEQRNKKDIIIVGLLGLILANIHGGTLVTCIIILIIVMVLDIILYILNKNIIENIIYDMVSIFAFILFSLINPYFAKIYLVGLQGPFLSTCNNISEWQGLDFNNISDFVIVFIFLITIISIVWNEKFKSLDRKTFLTLCLLCALFMLGISSIRGVLIAHSIMLIFGYKYLEEFYFHYTSQITIEFKLINKIKNSMLLRLLKNNVNIMVISMLIIVIINGYLLHTTNNFKEYINNKSPYSINIINYIKELPKGTKVFNFYSTGNYMLFNDCKVFIDSRQHPYHTEFEGNDSLSDMFNCIYSYDYYNGLLKLVEKYDIEYVFWSGEFDVGYDVLEKFEQDFEVIMTDKTENQEYAYNQYLFRRK